MHIDDLRPAALYQAPRKGHPLPRVLIFADHNDAFASMKAYNAAGVETVMLTFEQFAPGQLPTDLPAVQQPLF